MVSPGMNEDIYSFHARKRADSARNASSPGYRTYSLYFKWSCATLFLLAIVNFIYFFLHPVWNNDFRNNLDKSTFLKEEYRLKFVDFSLAFSNKSKMKSSTSKDNLQDDFGVNEPKDTGNDKNSTQDEFTFTVLRPFNVSSRKSSTLNPQVHFTKKRGHLVKFEKLTRLMNKQTSKHPKIAAVNVAQIDLIALKQALPRARIQKMNFYSEESITWDEFYPEFKTYSEVSCPISPPYSGYYGSKRFDAIIVHVPCNASAKTWSNDPSRHVSLLNAAELTVDQTEGSKALVIVLSPCRPTPNLFLCSELKGRRKDVWIYRVDKEKLKHRLSFPAGSCELAVSVDNGEVSFPQSKAISTVNRREAYATVLHSKSDYVCGALVLARSLLRTGTERDLVLLHDSSLPKEDLSALRKAGWILKQIERIRNPHATKDSYNEWNYSKLRLWELVKYDKIVFIDADILVLKNMDFLFFLPEISAPSNGQPRIFNSGVMVIQPSSCTFEMMMSQVNEIIPYNGGDQGFLNEIFTWWHRIPYEMNFFKQFNQNDPNEVAIKSNLIKMKPPSLYAIHYLGIKPWMCFRDYDCNWIYSPSLHQFANDEAHKLWWEYHDELSSNLQKFCLIDDKQKQMLLWQKEQARAKGYKDGHWNLTIKDVRFHSDKTKMG